MSDKTENDPRKRVNEGLVAVQSALVAAIDRMDMLVPDKMRRNRMWRQLYRAQRAVTEASAELWRDTISEDVAKLAKEFGKTEAEVREVLNLS